MKMLINGEWAASTGAIGSPSIIPPPENILVPSLAAQPGMSTVPSK